MNNPLAENFILSLNFGKIVDRIAYNSEEGPKAMLAALRNAIVQEVEKPLFDFILFLDYKSIFERCIENNRIDVATQKGDAVGVLKAEFTLLAKQFDHNISKSKSL